MPVVQAQLYCVHAVHAQKHPTRLDSELRRRAKAEGKSLNSIVIEALIRGAGLSQTTEGGRRRELGDIAGTWQEDPELDQVIAEQDQIDERLWR